MVFVAICFEPPKAIGSTQTSATWCWNTSFQCPFSGSLPDCHLKLSTWYYIYISALHNNDSWRFSSSSLIFTLILPQKKPFKRKKKHHQVLPQRKHLQLGTLEKNTTTKKHTILRRVQRAPKLLRRVGSSIEFPTKLHLEIHRWPFANRFLRWHPTRLWLSTSEWCGNKNSGSEKSQGGKHGKTIPSWELTYPPPRHFSRWFSFSQGGIC